MAFKFLYDRPKGTIKKASSASTAYTIGQPVKVVNNVFVAAAAGDKIFGIVATAKPASDTSTDPIEVVPVRKSDIMEADVGTGTMSDAYVDSGTMADLKSGAASTVDLDTTANNDVEIVGWDGVNTAKVHVTFQNTVF